MPYVFPEPRVHAHCSMNHTPVNAPPQVRLAAHTGRKSGVFVLIVINSAGLSTWLVVFLLDVHSWGRGSWSRSFFQHGGELGRQHWEMWMQLSQRDGVNGAV